MQDNDHVLSDDMLRGFAERCGRYDRENRFFHEDFEELKRAGYLTMAVPKELGGRGLTLAQCCREQRGQCLAVGLGDKRSRPSQSIAVSVDLRQ